MKSSLFIFFTVTITGFIVGAGSGIIIGLCASASTEWEYQLVFSLSSAWIGAAIGLMLGWITYYLIFRQKISFEIFCAVVSITCLITSVSAFLLQWVNTEMGWLAIFVSIPIFFVICFKLRRI